jgi:hypothetical protein
MKLVSKRLDESGTGFGKFLYRAIIFILSLFVLYMLYFNVVYAYKHQTMVYVAILLPVIILMFVLSYKLQVSPVVFSIIIFVSAFVLKGAFILLIKSQPISDFQTYYICAKRLFEGNRNVGHSQYFATWGYQMGPVLYYTGIMKLFGTGLLGLKLVNCFFMAGTNVFIYLIARKISNDYTARFVSLLYVLYPAPYFLSSVLTNQHFTAFMFLAGIYFLISDNFNILVRGILSGLLMSAGNAVRPIGVVVIGAVLIWGLIELIRSKRLKVLAPIILLAAVYFFTSWGISKVIQQTDICPTGLKNNFPLWKFVIGLNYDSQGRFSFDDENNIFYISDTAKRDVVAKETIKDRLSIKPSKLANLFDTKVKIMWGDFDTMRWASSIQGKNGPEPSKSVAKLEPFALKTEKAFYIWMIFLLAAGMIIILFNKKLQSSVLLLSTIVLCYIGAHILIEIQVRYRYFAVILMFILAAKGSELLFSSLYKYRRNHSLMG